jgi:hypothetical protein
VAVWLHFSPTPTSGHPLFPPPPHPLALLTPTMSGRNTTTKRILSLCACTVLRHTIDRAGQPSWRRGGSSGLVLHLDSMAHTPTPWHTWHTWQARAEPGSARSLGIPIAVWASGQAAVVRQAWA